MINEFIRDADDNFESISDFKYALVCGREIEFEWNGKTYGAFREDDGIDEAEQYFLCEAFKDDEGVFFDTADKLLEHIVDGRPLKDFITKVKVNWRNL